MVVGLTGGIGSGKTFVASIFEKLGVPVYLSDIEAKKIMTTNKEVIKQITALLGSNAYHEGVLNRKYIAKVVFENKDKLSQLNAIVHPAVRNHFEHWYSKQQANFVIKESAILFEIEGNKHCDAVILVTAPEDIRITRVIKRDHISKQEVMARIKNQWPDHRKIPISDYVIENINKTVVIKKIEEVFETLNKKFMAC